MYLIIASSAKEQDARELVTAMSLLGARAEFLKAGRVFGVIRALLRGSVEVIHVMGFWAFPMVLATKLFRPSALVVWTLEVVPRVPLAGRWVRWADQLIVTSEKLQKQLRDSYDIASTVAPHMVHEHHHTVSPFLLDRRNIKPLEYILVEKGARVASVSYTLPLVRLTGRESSIERDTLYSGARAVVVYSSVDKAIAYGKVPIVRPSLVVSAELATVRAGEPLPSAEELQAMGYLNRSIVHDYYSPTAQARSLLAMYNRQQFAAHAIATKNAF